MGRGELQAFFDLGNSTRRADKTTIGEKGHGTKIYYNAKKLVVDTQREGTRFIATLEAPFSKLHDRKIPEIAVREEPSETSATGTSITISAITITAGSALLTVDCGIIFIGSQNLEASKGSLALRRMRS